MFHLLLSANAYKSTKKYHGNTTTTIDSDDSKFFLDEPCLKLSYNLDHRQTPLSERDHWRNYSFRIAKVLFICQLKLFTMSGLRTPYLNHNDASLSNILR